MIPSISPPTDSLYKLMAIFGLGLFVLGVINTTTYSDDFMTAKIEIENIKHSISDSLFKYGDLSHDFQKRIRNEELKSMNLGEMSEALESLESYIFETPHIPGNVKTYLSTQIDIIQIKYLVSHNQRTLNYLVIAIAGFLMTLGFILWYIKDQRWKDLQLKKEAQNA
jgi:hypothetical protein